MGSGQTSPGDVENMEVWGKNRTQTRENEYICIHVFEDM